MEVVLLLIALAATIVAIFWVKRNLSTEAWLAEWREIVIQYTCEFIEQPGEEFDLKLSDKICPHCGAYHWEPVVKGSIDGNKRKTSADYIESNGDTHRGDQRKLALSGRSQCRLT